MSTYIQRIHAMLLGLGNVLMLLKQRNYFKNSTEVGNAVRKLCTDGMANPDLKQDPVHQQVINGFAIKFTRMRLGELTAEVAETIRQYKLELQNLE